MVATALCKLVEAVGKHPGLRSNGFFEDGVLAATAKACPVMGHGGTQAPLRVSQW